PDAVRRPWNGSPYQEATPVCVQPTTYGPALEEGASAGDADDVGGPAGVVSTGALAAHPARAHITFAKMRP
ncbi:MAG: hypothetical protein MJB57_02180, partial [Gemmatimonadetes bacterium]|nr:hypothetical protein [Gemmatimonadota bacterium]